MSIHRACTGAHKVYTRIHNISECTQSIHKSTQGVHSVYTGCTQSIYAGYTPSMHYVWTEYIYLQTNLRQRVPINNSRGNLIKKIYFIIRNEIKNENSEEQIPMIILYSYLY